MHYLLYIYRFTIKCANKYVINCGYHVIFWLIIICHRTCFTGLTVLKQHIRTEFDFYGHVHSDGRKFFY